VLSPTRRERRGMPVFKSKQSEEESSAAGYFALEVDEEDEPLPFFDFPLSLVPSPLCLCFSIKYRNFAIISAAIEGCSTSYRYAWCSPRSANIIRSF